MPFHVPCPWLLPLLHVAVAVMTICIALDGMGGDHAPDIVVDGASQALKRMPQLRFLLFGDEALLRPHLARHSDLDGVCEVRHTADRVLGDAKPSVALRQGRQSSMRLAIDAVKEGQAAAAVSAGNTGALMAMAKVVLKTLPGIDRPALASVMPGRKRPVIVLDLGANVHCDANDLFQFAVMGEVAARTVLGVAKPRIGLLNVGTEEVKGDDVVRKAAGMLRGCELPVDFAGFVEGNDVTDGSVDVVVTDGFTGNVALKMAEGTVSLFSAGLKEAFQSSILAKVGYVFARKALDRVREKFDPRQYNGAMFLGVNGVVVKSHGGADAVGFSTAIRVAFDLVGKGANDRIIEEMNAVSAALEPRQQAAAS